MREVRWFFRWFVRSIDRARSSERVESEAALLPNSSFAHDELSAELELRRNLRPLPIRAV
jgi:hypothetical protein